MLKKVRIGRLAGTKAAANALLDPFLPNEPSPLLTKALQSSLWEIYSHKQHYAQPVSAMAKVFSEAFTKPSYLLEDFLDHTYGTVGGFSVLIQQTNNFIKLYTSESKRKVVQEPALGIQESKPFGDPMEQQWQNNVDPCKLWAK